jgi:hypothetical protein
MRSGRRGWGRVYDIWFGVLLAFGYVDLDLWDGSDLEDRLDLGASAARAIRDIEPLNLSRTRNMN